MREDMKHVLIDRPRAGGLGGKTTLPKGTLRVQQAELQRGEERARGKMSRGLYASTSVGKHLTDHIRPLFRWMDKQVGRPWDQVWSEVCAGLSTKNPVTFHVRKHAIEMVETRCMYVQDRICNSLGEPLQKQYWLQYFVDPRTGLLRRLPQRRFTSTRAIRRQAEQARWIATTNPLRKYYQQAEGWVEVCFSRTDAETSVFDLLRQKVMTPDELSQAYGSYLKPVAILSIGHRRLKRLVRDGVLPKQGGVPTG